MIKLISVLIVFASLSCNGQIVATASDNQYRCYLGIENPISIAVEDVSDTDMIIKTDNGKVIKEEPGHYNFHPDKVGKANIIIYKKTNGHLKEIGRRTFLMQQLPTPIFKIGPSSGGYVSKKMLSQQEYVRADFEGFEGMGTILGFKMCIIRRKSCLYNGIENYSGKLSDESIKALSQVQEGDEVIFKNIYVQWPTAFKSYARPGVFIVTE